MNLKALLKIFSCSSCSNCSCKNCKRSKKPLLDIDGHTANASLVEPNANNSTPLSDRAARKANVSFDALSKQFKVENVTAAPQPQAMPEHESYVTLGANSPTTRRIC